jgi:type II secretory pathway component GspD/PulD (secretin)
MATGAFAIPLSPKTFLVAKDTQQKRVELEPVVAIAIPLPGAITEQDFRAAVTAVQQALTLEKVSFDTPQNMVILRDRISKVLPARAMLEDLLHQRGQVAIDLRLLEVSRNDAIEYGIEFPTLFSLTPLTNAFNNSFSLSSALSGVLTFGGGKTLIGLGIMTPQMVATLSNGMGKVLLDTELPTVEGQPATSHMGERYPVATSTYSANATTTATSGSATQSIIPQFSYEDLGLILKVTARLHGEEEVTLDVDAAYKLLTGNSNNGIPIVSNRAVKSNIRIVAGDWAVLSGLLDANDAVTISGLAGVSRIPYLGALTRTKTKTKSTDQVLILLRARVLSLPPGQFPTRTYRIGSETRPMIPL